MALEIVKLIEVVDTRDYRADGDRFVAVPGSGQARDCDRCGRSHEIHAHVELADGSRAVVGTGCMGRAELNRAATNAQCRAATVRKQQAELAECDRIVRAWGIAMAQAAEITAPKLFEGFASWDPRVPMFRCDVHSDCTPEGSVRAWRIAMVERLAGFRYQAFRDAEFRAEWLTKRLDK